MNIELSRRMARAMSIVEPNFDIRFELANEVDRAESFDDLSPHAQEFILHAESMGKSASADALKFNENHDESGRFASGDGAENVYPLPTSGFISSNNQISATAPHVGLSAKAKEVAARISGIKKTSVETDANGNTVTTHTATYTSKDGEKFNLFAKETIDLQGRVDGYAKAGENSGALKYNSLGDHVVSGNTETVSVVAMAGAGDSPRQGVATALLEFARATSSTPIFHSTHTTDDGTAFAESVKTSDISKAGVPGPAEVERALSRLEILPNPNHPELDNPEKFVESPWQVVPVPTINPNLWDDALIKLWDLDELYGTDTWLKRKNVKRHIELMGQAMTPYRSFALVAVVDGKPIIIDGHHRLFASWLLGEDSAPAYTIVIE